MKIPREPVTILLVRDVQRIMAAEIYRYGSAAQIKKLARQMRSAARDIVNVRRNPEKYEHALIASLAKVHCRLLQVMMLVDQKKLHKEMKRYWQRCQRGMPAECLEKADKALEGRSHD